MDPLDYDFDVNDTKEFLLDVAHQREDLVEG